MDFDISGIEDVQDKLGDKAIKDLRRQIDIDVSEGTHDMAELSYDNAPVYTGALRASILASFRKEGPMEYLFGSHLPYAQRQEYEHKTKKAYFRRAIWAEAPQLQGKITATVKRRLD